MRDGLTWFERYYPFLIGMFALALIAFVVVDCREREACEQVGGEVEEYNQHTVLMPVPCGSGCTVMVPEEVSDWRCVDPATGKKLRP